MMPLGPNTLAFSKELQKEEPTKPMSEFSVSEARETLIPGFADLATPFPDNAQAKDFIRHEVILPSGKTIIFDSYIPTKVSNQELLPTVVYFYGGGFCLNLFEAQRAPMAALAIHANCQVININYPLAPEHHFHEIIDICYETINVLYNQNQTYRISRDAFMLSGCSSGGTIAALLTNRSLSNPELNIRLQILFSPLVDCSLSTHNNNELISYQQQDFLQTDDALQFYVDSLQLDSEKAKSPKVSPYYDANLGGLSKTAIIVGEYDSLRGDGSMYARRLKEQGVDADLIICEGQIHAALICRTVLNDNPDPAIVAADFILKNLISNAASFAHRPLES